MGARPLKHCVYIFHYMYCKQPHIEHDRLVRFHPSVSTRKHNTADASGDHESEIEKEAGTGVGLRRKQETKRLTVSTEDDKEEAATYKDQEGLSSAALSARRKAARAQVNEMVSNLPIGTAFTLNKVVIKLQARTRGILSRKQHSKQVQP